MESPIINTLGFLPLMGLTKLVDGTVALFLEPALEDRLLILVHAFGALLSVKASFLHHDTFPNIIYWGFTNLANLVSRGVISPGSH